MKKRIVTIGGGTGTSVVLSGLKQYDVDLTAIISMSDSGGSTGRLRDEFGFQPVGDLRQSLAALAREGTQEWVRNLLLYRFDHGKGLKGHNLGNLILTALQDMSGSTPQALEIAEKMLNLKGKVYPSTTEIINLGIEFQDGTSIIGEDKLNPGGVGGKKIRKILLIPKAKLYKKAKLAIETADLLVIGPGDLYASILPNFLVSGMKQTIKNSNAKIMYVLNLMSRYTQTHGYKALDHVREVEKYSGRKPDFIVVNNGKISEEILRKYEKEFEYPIVNNIPKDEYRIIVGNLASVVHIDSGSDTIHRSLLRHDENKLAQIIMKIS